MAGTKYCPQRRQFYVADLGCRVFDCRSPKPELLQLLLSTVKSLAVPQEQHRLENGYATSNGKAHDEAELPNGKLANGHAANGLQNGHAPKALQLQVITNLSFLAGLHKFFTVLPFSVLSAKRARARPAHMSTVHCLYNDSATQNPGGMFCA